MESLGRQEDPWSLLKRAVNDGRSSDRAAWAAVGLPGIWLLLDLVTNRGKYAFESPSPRDALLEYLPRAIGAIAEAHPDAFLDVFCDPTLDENLLVLAGLGKIDSELATDRLIAVAKSTDPNVRVSVAHGLGRRKSPEAIQALLELRNDANSSVRYNANLAVAVSQVPDDELPRGVGLVRLLEQAALEARPKQPPQRQGSGLDAGHKSTGG
jgi:HEAT repeat protein